MKIINKTKTTNLENLKSNKPKYVVIHSTKNYPSFRSLLKFHKKRGWEGVGYHFFISKSSKLYQARPIDKEGAHAKGFNFESIGICVYRKNDKPIKKNLIVLQILIKELLRKNPKLKIVSYSLMQLKYINQNLNKKISGEANYNFEKIKIKLNKLIIQDEKLKKCIDDFNDCPGNWFYNLF